MDINTIDKKIDELFIKLEENIKELDKENLKKHLKNLQNAEKEYNKKSKLFDLEIKSYKEKITELKSENTGHIEEIMCEAAKKIDNYVNIESGLAKKELENFKAELSELILKYSNEINNRIKDVKKIDVLINDFEKRVTSYNDIFTIQNNKLNEKDLIINNLQANFIELKENVINIISTIKTWENRRNLENNEIGIFMSKKNEQIERLNKANEYSQKQIEEVNRYVKELKNEINFLRQEVRDKNKIIEEKLSNNKQGLGEIIRNLFTK